MTDFELLELPDSDTTCGICYAEFLDPEDLSIHISQVHTSTLLVKTCQFCYKSLPGLEAYAIHLRDVHLPNLRNCKYCNRTFDDLDEYRKHESKHYNHAKKSEFTCSQCKKIIGNIAELEQHEVTMHSDCHDGVFLHECFPLLSSLLNIKSSRFLQSLGDEDVTYMCSKCELSTSDVNEYIKHLKTGLCQSFACDMCSSVYRDKKGLNRHFAYHTECYHCTEKQYKKCPECYEMYVLKTWREHKRNCKVIKCVKCLKLFNNLDELAKHQTTVHPSTVQLQACNFCRKDYAGEAALKKHVQRAHKKNLHLYKYSCIYCKCMFKHPRKLFGHFFSTHKDLQPYTCKICDKKFKLRKRFTLHIKLDHKSIGYTKFDKNYHVYFSDKRSDTPPPTLAPTSVEETVKDEKSNETAEQIAIQAASSITLEPISKTDETNNETNNKTEQKNEDSKPDDDFNVIKIDSLSETDCSKDNSSKHVSPKKKFSKSRKRLREKTASSGSSDDEPLIVLRREHKLKIRNATWNRKKYDLKIDKRRFMCKICQKDCYTFQNYNNHVSLHKKTVTIKCVKCSKVFNSNDELNSHCIKEHSTSQLTETLKNLLERRKKGIEVVTELSRKAKFERTIKKVTIPTEETAATLKPVKNNGLSVQKFIESFTPEADAPRKDIIIDTSITIKEVKGLYKKPSIKINKCNLLSVDFSKSKLAMPVRFKQTVGEIQKATIRVVQAPVMYYKPEILQEAYNEDQNDQDVEQDESENAIPEVAQEIMLGSEDTPKTHYFPHKIVIPKLPADLENVHIAHLQSEAPFYKIVKVDDVFKSSKKKMVDVQPVLPKKDIHLPDGTKLVNVNPLAHLLGGTPVELILGSSQNKYYQAKPKDFETAIAKAMLKLKNPEDFPKKRRKKVDVEQ